MNGRRPEPDELRPLVRERLKEKRYRHVLGCEEECVSLARRWEVDERDARSAALLHDIAKEIDVAKQLKYLAGWGIIIDASLHDCPQLLHCYTGAELAAREYGMPEHVVSAIRFHSTGRKDMLPLEKILFIADLTEPSRPFAVEQDITRLRELSYRDLDRAVAGKAAVIIRQELSKGRIIHPDTLTTYNEYVRSK